MKKGQSDRLTHEKIRGGGPKEIFNPAAQRHDLLVRECAKEVTQHLEELYTNLKFRFRYGITKDEINKKLNKIHPQLGVSLFVPNANIKPDGGIVEVKDFTGNWRIILVSEAKAQGKDIENIHKGILVGKNNNQELMVAGNAIERSHKNINEIRNLMLDERHFPYILFLEGSNFLNKPYPVTKPDGTILTLSESDGSLNRLDRLTAANYGMPINKNNCKNLDVSVNGNSIMLQAVSIYTNTTAWNKFDMFSIMLEISKTSLKILELVI